MKRNWFNKKVLILGLSTSGIAAAKYLALKGADCFITEKREFSENDKKTIQELESLDIKVEMGVHSDDFLEGSYIAVTSPGITPYAPIFGKLKELNIPVISEIELAYLESSTPFIAITGTNGKTTTTALTSHILQSEYKAPTCGNIGLPPITLIDEKNDFLVCELSSYQLETSSTFKPQIACWLNFTPDHLEWHQSLENYFNAKAKLFASYKAPAFAIFNAVDENVFEFGKNYGGEKYFFGAELDENCCYMKDDAIFFKKKNHDINGVGEKIIELKDIPIVGEHNYQNAMVAIIIAKLTGIDNEKIIKQIKSFKAVEHRLEYVAVIGDSAFYNDSKATNPEATIVALKSFQGKTMSLILGGRDKNTDLSAFCLEVKDNVKNVILIGEAADRFEKNLTERGFEAITRANSMEEAIEKAIEINNEISLLSPACASFDMFENFEQRGSVFKNYVLSRLR